MRNFNGEVGTEGKGWRCNIRDMDGYAVVSGWGPTAREAVAQAEESLSWMTKEIAGVLERLKNTLPSP